MHWGRWMLALIVVAAAVLVLTAVVARNLIAENDRSADEFRQATSELRSQAERLEANGMDRASLEAAYWELLSSVPQDPEMAELIESLVELERSTGASLLRIDLSEPTPIVVLDDGAPTRQEEIFMSLEVRGTQSLVQGFVGRLRHQSRLVVVDSLHLVWHPPDIDLSPRGRFNTVRRLDSYVDSEGGLDGLGLPASEGLVVTADLAARAFKWSPDYFDGADTGTPAP